MAVSLNLVRTEERCKRRSFGIGPTCGAYLLQPELSADAQNELIKRGIPVPALGKMCLNVLSGCALKDTAPISAIQKLLHP